MGETGKKGDPDQLAQSATKGFEALESLREEDEVLAIGGETIYRECVPMAKRIYLTEVEANIWDGDVYFPELDLTEWKIKTTDHYARDSQHEYGFSFKVLERY